MLSAHSITGAGGARDAATNRRGVGLVRAQTLGGGGAPSLSSARAKRHGWMGIGRARSSWNPSHIISLTAN